MRMGHWDAQFGISGDMALGSILAAGARLEAVNDALATVGVAGLAARTTGVMRGGIACTKVDIIWEGTPLPRDHDHHHMHRPYRAIVQLLHAANLSAGVRERALAVFAKLAEAEAAIHGCPIDTVSFHEVGGQDALGDVVGTCAAIEDLEIDTISISSLPAGGGVVSAAHGLLPVPSPAVARLLRGFRVHPGPVEAELVTPTGAAMVAALCSGDAGSWPTMIVEGDGWGAGSAAFTGHPNATRFVWGSSPGSAGEDELVNESLLEIDSAIDDQTPQTSGYLQERLLALGALDVVITPAWMKKQRPGIQLHVLIHPAQREAVIECLLAESSTIGFRLAQVQRQSLPRKVIQVETRYGSVGVKLAYRRGRIVNVAPEYDDCRRCAQMHGVALKAVQVAAIAAAPFVGDAVP